MFLSRSSAMRNTFLKEFVLGTATLLVLQNIVNADEVPAFFLKIAKNIPRVGRSGRFDDFFFKSAKNIPRIGRSDSGVQSTESWTKYDNEAPFQGPIKRRMDYPQINDAWSWQNFPLAIEGPPELWRTLAGYARDTGDDIDNEIWQRKKRTGNDHTNSDGN